MKRTRTSVRVAAALSTIVLAATACGSDDPVDAADMWARPTAADATTAAFYGTLTNNTDALVSFHDGYSRACERIEFQRSSTVEGDESTAPATAADLQIASGEALTLEPMGLFVTCIGLVEPLVEGTPISLEFTFEETGAFVTEVAIEER